MGADADEIKPFTLKIKLSECLIEGIDRPKDNVAMRFRSKLLQPRKAEEPTLTKIYDVYMTPDGRVESKEDDLVETLQRDAEVLDRLRSPKSSWNRS